ncbi:MAG: cupin domain-containing protein [Vulcanimicrobiota bacterium]
MEQVNVPGSPTPLLSPQATDFSQVAAEIFEGDLFDKQWKLFPREPLRTCVTGLVTQRDIEARLRFSPAYAEELRVVFSGHLLDRSEYTHPGGGLDYDRLEVLLQAGASTSVHQIHRYSSHLRSHLLPFERYITGCMGVNYYYTPAGSRALGSHYDTHNILVAQISGQKHWRLGELRQGKPLRKVGKRAGVKFEDERFERLVLKEGDLFFLPRGLEHDAGCRETHSAHLTLGFHPVTNHSLLVDLLEQASLKRDRLRSYLAKKAETTLDSAYLRELLSEVQESLTQDSLQPAPQTSPHNQSNSIRRDRAEEVAQERRRVGDWSLDTSPRDFILCQSGARSNKLRLRKTLLKTISGVLPLKSLSADSFPALEEELGKLLLHYLWINGFVD